MPNKEEVESFLRALHGKMIVYDVAYRPRDKTLKSLIDLEMTPGERLAILKSLTYEDCFTGPNKDGCIPPMPDYYEYGKVIRNQTIYIKINIGRDNRMIDCMSFHIAERPITYPLKKN